MDFSTLPSLSGEALTEALSLDLSALDNDALTAALTERKAHASALFATEEPTVAQVNVAEALVASIGAIETEQTTRAAAVKDAADRFAAAKATFSAEDGGDDEPDEGDEDVAAAEDGEDDDAVDEADETTEEPTEGDEGDEAVEAAVEEDPDKKKEEAMTASAVDHTNSQKVKASTAKAVARKVKRPAVKATSPVVITAAADIPNVQMGSQFSDMEAVTAALIGRSKGFAPFNLRTAQAVNSQSGGQPVLSKFAVASFDPQFDPSMVASGKVDDYSAVRAAIKGRDEVLTASMGSPEAAMTAAGWCAPSENIYSYIADYVVDGLSKTPEVKAPRGGLNITTGPARSSQDEALDDFGWTQTEAEAEAGTVKPCETIVCPDFEDHRLDAIGYCYKIPILTQKAYPELITDALKFANVLYAHRVNRRVIADKVLLSDARDFSGYGPSFTDTLEAVSILAVKERRKWSIGMNATMTVEVPLWVQEVFRADMSRRAGLALDDVATDQKIAAHFAARKLDVQYVADWQELPGEHIVLNETFDILVYPAGTFVKAIEDVINLSAVYDAASLSVNEYTGVFFEQGYLLAKVGYGSSIITVVTNTAGEAGALSLTGAGDATSAGSF